MMEAHDRLYVEQANYARTIPIDTLGVQTTQFSIDDDPELKRQLFQSGRDARRRIPQGPGISPAYIIAALFRTGEQPHPSPAGSPRSGAGRPGKVMTFVTGRRELVVAV